MPRYTITEPHPTVAKNTYVHAGRGGAGNHFRAPQTTAPSGVPTALPPTASTSSTSTSGASSSAATAAPLPPRRFYSGRGGAGNAHSHAERPVLSFEDEFSRADKRERSAALGSGYHVGRGGAGNFASGSGPDGNGPTAPSFMTGKKSRTGSGSSVASSESAGSVGSGILRRLSGVLRH